MICMADNISQIDKLLNPTQLAAVTYCDGPSVIVAGTGSGKTRVLTYKVAYLIAQGSAGCGGMVNGCFDGVHEG